MLPSVYMVLLAGLLMGQTPASSKAAPNPTPKAAPKQSTQVNANAAVISDFVKRVNEYVAVHKKLEDTLPKLSKDSTPKEIDTHERALLKLMQEARKGAKQGDVLTLRMQRFIRNLLRPIFTGKSGEQIKAEILDKEYKGNAPLAVNARYPDEVPISTVPPQVLQSLPKLTEDIEYRFIQNSLILFDPHAHMIVDFMERAFN